MNMAASKTTTHYTIAECPACHKDITATVLLDVTMGKPKPDGDKVSVPLTGTMSGIRVDHDCIPKVTRHVRA